MLDEMLAMKLQQDEEKQHQEQIELEERLHAQQILEDEN